MNFGINIGQLLASQGDVGQVYELQLGNKKYIVKYIDHESQEENDQEIYITILASELGVGPKVLSYSDDYIVMEYIDTKRLNTNELSSYENAINRKLDVLYDHGVYHGDLNKGNVLVSKNGRVYIIDYGLSEYSDEPIEHRHRRYYNFN